MLKVRFFRSLPVNIFWKSRTPFWISTKLCTVVLGHSRKPFLYWEVRKNVTSYDGVIRTFFCWKIQNLYFAWLHGQLFEHGVLNHDEIWYWVPWNVWSCNWYKIWRSKIFEWLCQKCSFLVLFYPLGPQLIPITTKHAQMWSTMLRVWM